MLEKTDGDIDRRKFFKLVAASAATLVVGCKDPVDADVADILTRN